MLGSSDPETVSIEAVQSHWALVAEDAYWVLYDLVRLKKYRQGLQIAKTRENFRLPEKEKTSQSANSHKSPQSDNTAPVINHLVSSDKSRFGYIA